MASLLQKSLGRGHFDTGEVSVLHPSRGKKEVVEFSSLPSQMLCLKETKRSSGQHRELRRDTVGVKSFWSPASNSNSQVQPGADELGFQLSCPLCAFLAAVLRASSSSGSPSAFAILFFLGL